MESALGGGVEEHSRAAIRPAKPPDGGPVGVEFVVISDRQRLIEFHYLASAVGERIEPRAHAVEQC